MKPVLSALSLLLLATSPWLAQAQSSVTLYGTLDDYLGYISSSSGQHVLGLNDGALVRSRVGLRGAENLGHGMQLTFVLEHGLDLNDGTDADSGRLFDRQAWVGLSTSSGEVRLGRQNSAIFAAGDAIDYTGRTSYGSVINYLQTPSRYNNDVAYFTPRIGGLQLTVHYAAPENGGNTSTAADSGNQAVYQLALDYRNGPYRIGYAGISASPNRLTRSVDQDVVAHNLYFNYSYDGGTVYAAFVHTNNVTSSTSGATSGAILSPVGSTNVVAGTDTNALRFYNAAQLSADYRFNPQWKIGALAGVIHDTSGQHSGARGANLGAFYNLSKITALYGFVNYLKNQANAGFRFGGSAAPSANLGGADVNGRSLVGLQLGLMSSF